ncbi:MAG: hypothetical protein GW823_06605 [Bacteroidetes bacterium]|nr:hypothetical protein [Bacteroidota bacterium]
MAKTVNSLEQTQEKSFELLNHLFYQNRGNEEHLENLHEIFMCFVRADDDHRPDRDSIISTYESLRHLLIESNKLFTLE